MNALPINGVVIFPKRNLRNSLHLVLEGSKHLDTRLTKKKKRKELKEKRLQSKIIFLVIISFALGVGGLNRRSSRDLGPAGPL